MDKKYIDAEALQADLARTRSSLLDDENYPRADTISYCMTRVGVAPAADVAPVRHGQWDGEGDGYAETEDGEMVLVYDVWICSECGYTIDDGTDDPDLLPNYCPHCGAKMDGEVGDNAKN